MHHYVSFPSFGIDPTNVMRAIGDPAQHSAVEAGGMWAQMVDQHPDRVPALTENRRQAAEETADLRLANADYRAGHRWTTSSSPPSIDTYRNVSASDAPAKKTLVA